MPRIILQKKQCQHLIEATCFLKSLPKEEKGKNGPQRCFLAAETDNRLLSWKKGRARSY